MLSQAHHDLSIRTHGPGFTDITEEAARWLSSARASAGLLTLFVRHTSASLLIQENADPDVLSDLGDALAALAPQDAGYRHTVEGPDDMPAHIRSMLTATSLQVPVIDGRMTLGTWQAIYLAEHRAFPHTREVVLMFQGTLRQP